jgi:hypothetical protein
LSWNCNRAPYGCFMLTKNRLTIILMVLPALLCAGPLSASAFRLAQVDSVRDSTNSDNSFFLERGQQALDSAATDTTAIDSLHLTPAPYTIGADTILIDAFARDSISGHKGPSPTGALLRSVVVPGWGQFANGRYVKAVVVAGVESFFIYRAISYGRDAADSKEAWQNAPDDQKTEAFSRYTDDRDNRNIKIMYSVLTVFLSMFDAYVDAHLASFPKNLSDDDQLSLDIVPQEKAMLQVSYCFW